MCRVADVAKQAIYESLILESTNNDKSFLLDFYKLNKLLYIAQGVMLARYDAPMFQETIYAYKCGPYIEELEFVFFDWNFELIEKNYEDNIELPPHVESVLLEVLCKYGKYNKQELGLITKNQRPWKEAFLDSDNKHAISLDSIKQYFSENNIEREFMNEFSYRKETG